MGTTRVALDPKRWPKLALLPHYPQGISSKAALLPWQGTNSGFRELGAEGCWSGAKVAAPCWDHCLGRKRHQGSFWPQH